MQENTSSILPIIYTPHKSPIDFPVVSFYNRKISTFKPKFLHFHDYFEIGFCHSNSGHIHFDNFMLEYHPDQFTIIPPLVAHITTIQKNPSYWDFIFFNPTILYQTGFYEMCNIYQRFYQFLEEPLQITSNNNPFLYQLLTTLFQELQNKKTLYTTTISALIRILLSEMNKKTPSQHPLINADNAPVRNALLYIFSHYSDPLSISNLAEYCGLSESHFRRLFKQVVGCSPNDYLHHYRIQHACQLMINSQESINQIATQVGYSTVSSFNRQFFQLTGTTPSSWKKKSQLESFSDYSSEFKSP